jgi:hypothetical protein
MLPRFKPEGKRVARSGGSSRCGVTGGRDRRRTWSPPATKRHRSSAQKRGTCARAGWRRAMRSRALAVRFASAASGQRPRPPREPCTGARSGAGWSRPRETRRTVARSPAMANEQRLETRRGVSPHDGRRDGARPHGERAPHESPSGPTPPAGWIRRGRHGLGLTGPSPREKPARAAALEVVRRRPSWPRGSASANGATTTTPKPPNRRWTIGW